MKLFVDGNGLIDGFRRLSDPIVKPRDEMDRRLNIARWLARYAELCDCDVICVFDGNPVGRILPPTERHGRVRVVNLEPDVEALPHLAGPANRAAKDEETFVVSDDYRFKSILAHGKAKLAPVADFLAQAKTRMRGEDKQAYDEPDEKFSGLARHEVDAWVNFFKNKKR